MPGSILKTNAGIYGGSSGQKHKLDLMQYLHGSVISAGT
jgi:hypothetical protein